MNLDDMMALDHQKLMRVEFNNISKLWEVRLDGFKLHELESFGAAESFAHRYCDTHSMLNIFLSFDTTGAES